MNRLLVLVSRYLLAFTFIFSGFVKGIDPLGSAYKFSDYFTALNISFFEPFALPLAFILCAAELYIGLLLLLRVNNVVAIWGALIFMAGFTPLTLYIAVFNPVSDCGCFGDAIVLSNWNTFFKNIPLLLAAITLFIYRSRYSSLFVGRWNVALTVVLLFFSFIPSLHGYRNLPLFDFRPYSIGVNIPEAMSIPPNSPIDEYKTILFYEKDGVVKEFNQDNFPWQDSTWRFVDSKSLLVKEGFKPPITDFVITDFDGWTLTDSILNHSGYYLLAISYRLDKSNRVAFEKLNELYFMAREHGIGFACITASPPSEVDKFISATGAAFPFLQADEIMLKTTIRSNPGLILLNEGTIIGKWHHRNIPQTSYFQGNLVAKQLKALVSERYKNLNFLLVSVVAGFVLLILSLKNVIKSNARDDSKEKE